MSNLHLPHNIRMIRKKWRMKQEDFGRLFGEVTGAAISNYERGLNQPSLEFLILLQDMSQVDMNRMIRSSLDLQEIPEKPLEGKTYEVRPAKSLVNEPETPYGDLYYFPNLVEKVKELEERMAKLEGEEPEEE